VLARQGREDPAQTTDFWRNGLRELAAQDGCNDDSAWKLLVSEPLKPAFMQSSVPTLEDYDDYRPKGDSPDALDVLQTAKNHDVKTARTSSTAAEDWIYTLISLQTMSGYLGAGNHGIARMNGGFASRPVVGLVPEGSRTRRFRRDVSCLLAVRPELIAGPWGYRADGLVLTWARPWDRKTALPLKALSPFFVEISRPLRLMESGGRITAFGATSKTARIAARDARGVLGDPWIPVKSDGTKGPQALTVGPAGLTPQLLRNLLFEEGYKPAAMQRPSSQDAGKAVSFSVSVLVRGQGTTNGFYQVRIPIPGRVQTALFAGGKKRKVLATRSKQALDQAGQMQNKVLKPAVLSLLQGGAAMRDIYWDKREVGGWWEATSRDYAGSWSTHFFPWLWQSLDQMEDEAAYRTWLDVISDKAEASLLAAIERYPQKHGRRYRARAVAEGIFRGMLYHNFPQLKEDHAHGPTHS